jgi:hypothetical protein
MRHKGQCRTCSASPGTGAGGLASFSYRDGCRSRSCGRASYLHETRETWQKIADRLMERIADLARAAPGG